MTYSLQPDAPRDQYLQHWLTLIEVVTPAPR
jgi:hypothetical protein